MLRCWMWRWHRWGLLGLLGLKVRLGPLEQLDRLGLLDLPGLLEPWDCKDRQGLRG